jgi:hypothetical protein
MVLLESRFEMLVFVTRCIIGAMSRCISIPIRTSLQNAYYIGGPPTTADYVPPSKNVVFSLFFTPPVRFFDTTVSGFNARLEPKDRPQSGRGLDLLFTQKWIDDEKTRAEQGA